MLALKPPAGEKIRISFSRERAQQLEASLQQNGTMLFASGAMALSAAIAAIVARRGLHDPKVLLPAYTCPSVPAAVAHAGARPVLVDLCPDSLMVDDDKLRAQLDDKTVAVICVNLFGVKQPTTAVRAACSEVGAVLVEDNAQGWPDLSPAPDKDEAITILSFGRGKQLSILGGGAAVINDAQWRDHLDYEQVARRAGLERSALFAGKVTAYNLLRWPPAFGFLERLAFTGIGETRYKALQPVAGLGAERIATLALGLQHKEADQKSHAQAEIAKFLGMAELKNVKDLSHSTAVGGSRRLLRYPLLAASKALRETLLGRVRRQGIGASIMYGSALYAVSGVPAPVSRQGPFPNAQALADRLLTLPIHSDINDDDLRRIFAVLRGVG